jgi:hypothetical protein
MAAQDQNQIQPPVTRDLESQPGIQRDGTDFYSNRWSDGQWVRFQRGKPKKMGGYRAMTNLATGPIRKIIIDGRLSAYTAHTFSPWGIERIQFDPTTGVGGGVTVRTPSALTIPNYNYNWSADKLVSSGGGSCNLLALAATDLADITSDAAGGLWYGDISAVAPMTSVTSGGNQLTASGDVVCLGPFVVLAGSNGSLQNSNPSNITDASGWTISSGANVYANQAYVAGTKFVKGLPIRGGGLAPAGLFWALDTLVRMSFQGASGGGYFNYWKYDTLSARTSVLSKNSIIEYDGAYFWVGVDRFFMYNGAVQELPNEVNLNYFFDNINIAQRQKVHAVKVPRYGEIWWFFPKGQGQVECNAAVIFNVRENCWYDAQLVRTSGQEADIFPSPILCGGEDFTVGIRVPYTATTGTFGVAQSVVGVTSGATGTVARVNSEPSLVLTNTTGIFQNVEGIYSLNAASAVPTTATAGAAGTATITFATMTTVAAVGSYVKVSGVTPTGYNGTYPVSAATATSVSYVNATTGAQSVAGTVTFSYGTGTTGAGTFNGTGNNSQEIDVIWQHEVGTDKVYLQQQSPIVSYITSQNFSYPGGDIGQSGQSKQGVNFLTRLIRVEPDFVSLGALGRNTGAMTMTVNGVAYPNSPAGAGSPARTYSFDNTTPYIDCRDQYREMTITFTSNAFNGFFEMGRILVTMEPGDGRG